MTRPDLRRTAQLVGDYASWACLVIVGVGIFLFFNLRSDLIACNAAYAEYNSQAQIERTQASSENNQALFEVIRTAQPLLDPMLTEPTEDQERDAFTAFGSFVDSYEAYRTAVAANPYKTLDEVCEELS